MKSRTFLVCFEPMRLLPKTEKAKLPCFFNWDYYETLAAAAMIMRERQRNIDRYTALIAGLKPTDHLKRNQYLDCIKSVEYGVDRDIEAIVGIQFLYYFIQEEVAEFGDFMQRLLPAGELTDVRLAFSHHRGMWYTGVASE